MGEAYKAAYATPGSCLEAVSKALFIESTLCYQSSWSNKNNLGIGTL